MTSKDGWPLRGGSKVRILERSRGRSRAHSHIPSLDSIGSEIPVADTALFMFGKELIMFVYLVGHEESQIIKY